MFAWFRRIYNQTVAFFRDSEGVGIFYRKTNQHERSRRVVERSAEPAPPVDPPRQPGIASTALAIIVPPADLIDGLSNQIIKRDGYDSDTRLEKMGLFPHIHVDGEQVALDGKAATDAEVTEVLDEAINIAIARKAAVDSVPVAEPRKGNRSQRRRISALEKARLKHDRWVTPKGELPEPSPRAKIDPTEERLRVEAAGPAIEYSPGDPGEVLMYDKVDGEEMLFLERELYGTFHFRDTLLDQLELYWEYLPRMKRHDPDAYALYKRLGATIVPPAKWLLHDGVHPLHEDEPKGQDTKKELTAWWKVHRPAFGCISYGLTPRVEAYENNPPDWRIPDNNNKKKLSLWVPKFFYFQKYDLPPSDVQPTTGGDVYALTVYWDKPHNSTAKKMKAGVPQEFAVFISNDGSDVHVLKTKKTYYAEPIKVKNRSYHDGKKGRKKPHAGRALKVNNRWHYPEVFRQWARENQSDTDIFLCNLFLDTARAFEGTGFCMTRVEVTNGDMAAVFSVDPRRMAYFFRDRDIEVNKDGHRKRIFHMVKPYTRHYANGTVKHFGLSFRGENEFDWAGYHVKITIPGRDHFALNEFDVGVSDEEYFVDKEDKGLSMGQIADHIHQWMDEGMLTKRDKD